MKEAITNIGAASPFENEDGVFCDDNNPEVFHLISVMKEVEIDNHNRGDEIFAMCGRRFKMWGTTAALYRWSTDRANMPDLMIGKDVCDDCVRCANLAY